MNDFVLSTHITLKSFSDTVKPSLSGPADAVADVSA